AYLSLAERDEGLGEEGRAHLTRAADQGERIRRILKQLLDYSKPPRPERVALDLAALARESVELAGTQHRYRDVDFRVEVEGELPEARGDPGMVAQVLLNLVINGADAALETGNAAAAVSLQLRPTALSARPGDDAAHVAQLRRNSGAADAVECLVADTGAGVPEDDRERIFDPFFTTKAPGEGTGLGLANARRLAEELGGRLELGPAGPSVASCGAVFRLVLPARSASDCGARTGIRS
ncbi:MAG: hypothetical protein GWO02_00695, partial [Gammaproteobacteria bacterium]|nr:hypothetical protein [Gammaproteobacteria bacterium]